MIPQKIQVLRDCVVFQKLVCLFNNRALYDVYDVVAKTNESIIRERTSRKVIFITKANVYECVRKEEKNEMKVST